MEVAAEVAAELTLDLTAKWPWHSLLWQYLLYSEYCKLTPLDVSSEACLESRTAAACCVNSETIKG